jgi:hypothetical protein
LAADASHLAFSTTYRRLLLDQHPGAFQLWIDEKLGYKDELKPLATCQPSDDQLTIRLDRASSISGTPLQFPDDITMWEIDTDFDEEQFNSHYQLTRDWRHDSLKTSILLDDLDRDNRVAIRVFDNHGRMGLSLVDDNQQY